MKMKILGRESQGKNLRFGCEKRKSKPGVEKQIQQRKLQILEGGRTMRVEKVEWQVLSRGVGNCFS
jgi:hypothetical protein